jgi:hypothetical protein
MTVAVKKAIREAQANIEKRAPVVERKLAAAGVHRDAALVFSTAQYFDTLKKLAKK